MTALTLVREIRARPSTVFDLLSTPEGLTAWWGPDRLPVLAAEADVRPGGAFRVRFASVDGVEHQCEGEFLEVDPPERIIMSWRWTDGGEPEEKGGTSRVEFLLSPVAVGTRLTLIHNDLCNAVSAASHRQGWNGALDKLLALMGDRIDQGPGMGNPAFERSAIKRGDARNGMGPP